MLEIQTAFSENRETSSAFYLEDKLISLSLHTQTVNALNYLKEQLKMMHRDVKPSNILLDRRGNIKLADYGICCALVDNIAKTRDAGCRPYMAVSSLGMCFSFLLPCFPKICTVYF